MTAKGLISQALGLQASYYVLKETSKQVYSTNIDRKPLITAGLAQSSSIILSFAVEIALKGLLKFRFNDFPKTHNLKKLYERLAKTDQMQISRIYNEKTDSKIEDCLERHKDMFMEFRYLELEVEEPNNNENVNAALNSFINFYNRIDTNTPLREVS